TLATSEHEQAGTAIARALRNTKELAAYRHPGHLAALKVMTGLAEVHRCRTHHRRNQAVREPGHYVRFKSKCRNAAEGRGQHRRAGSIATHSDHDLRPVLR